MFDGSDVHVKSAGKADIRTEAIGAGRELREPGIDATLGDSKGTTTQICVGRAGGSDPTWCGRGTSYGQQPHWIAGPSDLAYKPEFEMSWTKAGGFGGLDFKNPLDLTNAASVDLRTAVDPTIGDVNLQVRLRDSDGKSVVIKPVNNGDIPALEVGSPPLSKRWAQTLRAPLDGVKGVDLSSIAGIDLIAGSKTGHVFVLDVASVPQQMPDAPSDQAAVRQHAGLAGQAARLWLVQGQDSVRGRRDPVAGCTDSRAALRRSSDDRGHPGRHAQGQLRLHRSGRQHGPERGVRRLLDADGDDG